MDAAELYAQRGCGRGCREILFGPLALVLLLLLIVVRVVG